MNEVQRKQLLAGVMGAALASMISAAYLEFALKRQSAMLRAMAVNEQVAELGRLRSGNLDHTLSSMERNLDRSIVDLRMDAGAEPSGSVAETLRQAVSYRQRYPIQR